MDKISTGTHTNAKLWGTLKVVLFIFLTLFLFFFAIDLMIASIQQLGRDALQSIAVALQNPFTGLFAGLLITAIVQSSSATTSVTVAMVASRSLTIQSAIPIIIGANVGTTITSSVISLGFVNKKKELKRAVAAASYHYFFNLLTLLIIFPLEYYYGILSNASMVVASFVFPERASDSAVVLSYPEPTFVWLINLLSGSIGNVYILILFSFSVLVASILVFRKLISDLLNAGSPEAFSRFFFTNELKSFSWGLITTAAIRSSTITTSVVVPMVAKKISTLKQAVPFIMGANIGTTITAFIAAVFNANTSDAGSIAIAHLLFNALGVFLFFPITVLKKVPVSMARWLGNLTYEYRFAGLVFILVSFFFLPFVLLYFSQN